MPKLLIVEDDTDIVENLSVLWRMKDTLFTMLQM